VYGGAAWQDLVSFILLVVILIARPGGLPSLVRS
jgi:branched-subunit amino acid ABC-type transport system permease component